MRFKPGKEYVRQDLHDQYQGQRYGGISTPAGHPIVMIFTGEVGEQYGYQDGPQPDGTFLYTGEGQVGDMTMTGGNRAIRDHLEDGKELHLFQIPRKRYVRYVGQAEYIDHNEVQAIDKEGNYRSAFVFRLALSDENASGEPIKTSPPKDLAGESGLWKKSLKSLREQALENPTPGSSKTERKAQVYKRSQAVRVYVLRRADGRCEGCKQEAPFTTTKGRPYLEPHHIRRVADRGPDHPRWVIALCPNCHRRVHYGEDGSHYNKGLADHLGRIEGDD